MKNAAWIVLICSTSALAGEAPDMRKVTQNLTLEKDAVIRTPLIIAADNLVIDGKLHGGGDWFCPNCGGLGAFETMAIPKADWESGATGYHLYACNKVNGIEACTVCGGSGGVYERWYVQEHPELRKIAFTRGSGLVSAQRPAPA